MSGRAKPHLFLSGGLWHVDWYPGDVIPYRSMSAAIRDLRMMAAPGAWSVARGLKFRPIPYAKDLHR